MDYEPVFNKLTSESFIKFAEIERLDLPKRGTKADLQTSLEEFFSADPDIESRFQQFYRETEEAGRKHFFLYKYHFPPDVQEGLHQRCLAEFEDESSRTFDPQRDNGKTYFAVSESRLVVKQIKIKKTLRFIGENESDGRLIREFRIIVIHFIQFWEFDFKRSRIICGFDAYGDSSLLGRRQMEKELLAFLDNLMGPDFASLENLITSEHIEHLRFLPNCLVDILANQATVQDSAVFRKPRADFNRILSELRQERYKISEIKEKNPSFDVQTNMLFEAGVASALDNNINLANNRADFCYFTRAGGTTNYFRFRIDAVKSQFITYSSSITKRELWDVFGRII